MTGATSTKKTHIIFQKLIPESEYHLPWLYCPQYEVLEWAQLGMDDWNIYKKILAQESNVLIENPALTEQVKCYSQEEINKSLTDACLYHSLDFVICSIR